MIRSSSIVGGLYSYQFSRLGLRYISSSKFRRYDTLLALEDTTSLQFPHASVHEELGHITSYKNSRGVKAHSILLFAPDEQHVLGLVEQSRWARASRNMAERLGPEVSKVISVCGQETGVTPRYL